MGTRNVSGNTAGTLAERAGVDDNERAARIRDVLARVKAQGLKSIRLSFADQHGILRGKTLVSGELAGAFVNGCSMTSTLLAKDTSHKTVFPVWQADGGLGIDGMRGASDFFMLPDPATFKVLPWLDATGWLLCDLYMADGRAVPLSTRTRLQKQEASLADKGWVMDCGLELEFHIFRLIDPKLSPRDAGQLGHPATPPDVEMMAHGFQYLTEQRQDELEPACSLLQDGCETLGLPLRSIETEFGPSQVEFTFSPLSAGKAADTMVLFRSMTKQICRRNGYHATFMARPKIDNVFSSGWHLHQSLRDKATGKNLFASPSPDAALSATGQHWLGGLLHNAAGACAFACPTLNGYRRFMPFSLAPDRIAWGLDNKGAMARVIADPAAKGARIENRIGEPAANPYLYLASQIACGLDGIEAKRDPGPPTETPYDNDAERLPRTLQQALCALETNDVLRKAIGASFVDYYLSLKHAEIERFNQTVSDWEHREYFEIF